MAKYFVEFFKKYPMQFSEHYVLKQIHKVLERAEKEHKKYPDSDAHTKHMCRAYWMLHDYFTEKGIDPNAHL